MMTTSRFYKLPIEIAQRRDLTPTAKLVYAAIVDRIGGNGYCWPGLRRLAKDCGCTVNAVRAAVVLLQRLGLVIVKRRQNGQANHYRIPGGSVSRTDTVVETKPCQKMAPTVSKNGAQPYQKMIRNQTQEPNSEPSQSRPIGGPTWKGRPVVIGDKTEEEWEADEIQHEADGSNESYRQFMRQRDEVSHES